jgi:hypothetical protein
MSQAPWTLFWPRSGLTAAPGYAHVAAEHGQVGQGFDIVRAGGVLGDAHAVEDAAGVGAGIQSRAAGDQFAAGMPVMLFHIFRRVFFDDFFEFFEALRCGLRQTFCRADPPLMMTCIMPLIQATSVPRFWRSQYRQTR